MLLGTWSASLIRNMLTGKRIIRARYRSEGSSKSKKF